MKRFTVPILLLTLLFANVVSAAKSPVSNLPRLAKGYGRALLMDCFFPKQALEAYLKKHPDNEAKREELLKLYSRDDKLNLDRIKYHTFEMIKYHPNNNYIAWSNCAAFYMDQQYARDVISRLEDQVSHGHTNREVYWLIAYISEHIALPLDFYDAAGKNRILKAYGLPKNTVFIS